MKQLWAPWRMSYLRGEDEKVPGCLFCHKVTQEDAVEHILYRGTSCFVVLNRFPYTNGHMMIVPYMHTGMLEALDEATLLEMMQLVQHSLRLLRQVFHPQGFNLGVNEGSVAGAGVAEHVHLHIVPRWAGDANYMTVIGETRVIPQSLEDTYATFRPLFEALHGG
ncbi:MAG TPA: HIT domain-containing protein [Anaerolineae bacterium]|nr:HIT domain-containing protein [Anaerolineae bacterium]HQH38134.1 HIT domain-containing protein [Anaerolineae bacterium]